MPEATSDLIRPAVWIQVLCESRACVQERFLFFFYSGACVCVHAHVRCFPSLKAKPDKSDSTRKEDLVTSMWGRGSGLPNNQITQKRQERPQVLDMWKRQKESLRALIDGLFVVRLSRASLRKIIRRVIVFMRARCAERRGEKQSIVFGISRCDGAFCCGVGGMKAERIKHTVNTQPFSLGTQRVGRWAEHCGLRTKMLISREGADCHTDELPHRKKAESERKYCSRGKGLENIPSA